MTESTLNAAETTIQPTPTAAANPTTYPRRRRTRTACPRGIFGPFRLTDGIAVGQGSRLWIRQDLRRDLLDIERAAALLVDRQVSEVLGRLFPGSDAPIKALLARRSGMDFLLALDGIEIWTPAGSRTGPRTPAWIRFREGEEPPAGAFLPEKDVRRDVEVVDEVELLVDEGHPRPLRFADRAERDLPPVEPQATRVGPDDPGQDLHERRLPRSVLADHRVYLAAAEGQRHPVEGPGGGVVLGQREGGELGHGRGKIPVVAGLSEGPAVSCVSLPGW